MALVIGVRAPFKVADIVIGLIAIDMVDIRIVLWIGYESAGDKTMDQYHLPITTRLEMQHEIPIPTGSRLQLNLWIQPPKSVTMLDRANLPGVGYLIESLITSHVTPLFHRRFLPWSKR